MKVVLAASEVVPFAKTGGLADVGGALPLALEEEGEEVVVVMPGYSAVQNAKVKTQKLKEDFSCAIIGKSIKVYFIENDKYFHRDGLYGDKTGDYPDNLERFSYYCRRTLELLKELNFQPDIIHAHDWQAGLLPIYLKTLYANDPFYASTKTMFTIHNIGYQGLFPKEEFPKLGLDWKFFNLEMLEFYDKVNILKGAIVFSDFITTVSPTYSREIQSKEFGFGLEGILTRRKESIFGILNGLDYSIWNPETDKFIARNFSEERLSDKYKNKADLQRVCKFPAKKEIPLLGVVSRLAEQKGFDILAQSIEKMVRLNLQLVILGTGDLKYHLLLEDVAKRYPKVVSVHLKFDDALAHKIYAGSDIFLMPSRYEPCGLGQMISLRYATIPLVFKTGGLADSVTSDNGFVFDNYSPEVLIKTVKKALSAYVTKSKWLRLMQAALKCNFSWKTSAREYIRLYEKMQGAK